MDPFIMSQEQLMILRRNFRGMLRMIWNKIFRVCRTESEDAICIQVREKGVKGSEREGLEGWSIDICAYS